VTIFTQGLKRDGFDVQSFTDPSAAIEYFKSNADSIDIIISDIRMPGITGFAFSKQARAIKPTVKVLLMTAYDLQDMKMQDEVPTLQIDEFLEKPILPSKLTEIVSRHLIA
jgi:DNA-binding NtrC family response regulator